MKRYIGLIVVLLAFIVASVCAVILIRFELSQCSTYSYLIKDMGGFLDKNQSTPNDIGMEMLNNYKEQLKIHRRNLVLICIVESLFVIVIASSVLLYFFPFKTGYTYEQYCSRREAKRAERQERKRKRLEEKLARMSRERES